MVLQIESPGQSGLSYRADPIAAALDRARSEALKLDVEHDQLDAEVERWCAEIMERSPTAIAIAKRSFNADSDNIKGIAAMGFQALSLYYATDEAKEGGAAFREKRKPKFREKLRAR